MSLSPEDVRDILSLLDALPVDELDLRTERFRLTLRRGADGQWTRSGTGLQESAPEPATRAGLRENVPEPAVRAAPGGQGAGAQPAPAGAQAPAERETTASQAAGLAEVRAPLPGTFYRAAKPGAPPFVEVGSRVGEDTVVGIIETMKMFNPIPAGMAGRVASIELADAEFAEQDAVLMRITPEDVTAAGCSDG